MIRIARFECVVLDAPEPAQASRPHALTALLTVVVNSSLQAIRIELLCARRRAAASN
jgi:hypothetical protein